jgi:hypothetical protein
MEPKLHIVNQMLQVGAICPKCGICSINVRFRVKLFHLRVERATPSNKLRNLPLFDGVEEGKDAITICSLDLQSSLLNTNNDIFSLTDGVICSSCDAEWKTLQEYMTDVQVLEVFEEDWYKDDVKEEYERMFREE